MEDGLVRSCCCVLISWELVLILVVMEDGLVLLKQDVNEVVTEGLNPCCSGRWSRTQL